jgi:hypothetical protein
MVNAMSPERTTEYATFQDAISFFVKKCTIIGADEYFPFLGNSGALQSELDFDHE